MRFREFHWTERGKITIRRKSLGIGIQLMFDCPFSYSYFSVFHAAVPFQLDKRSKRAIKPKRFEFKNNRYLMIGILSVQQVFSLIS